MLLEMTGARTRAARLRGGFVGATSASVAVAAHSVGGGAPPAGATVVLLVLACATIAAAATSARIGGGVVPVLGFVVAAQLVGHCVLVVSSGHVHGGHWTVPMMAAHLLAALGCAALICAAERLCIAVSGELRRLIVVMLGVDDDDSDTRKPQTLPITGLVPRIIVLSGLGTRAPPRAAAIA
jgi:hypothetical protein